MTHKAYSTAVKAAIAELGDAIESARIALDALADETLQTPASAEAQQLTRAAHACQVAALWLSWQAQIVAKVSGVLTAAAAGVESGRLNLPNREGCLRVRGWYDF
jgi:hypothetical protein